MITRIIKLKKEIMNLRNTLNLVLSITIAFTLFIPLIIIRPESGIVCILYSVIVMFINVLSVNAILKKLDNELEDSEHTGFYKGLIKAPSIIQTHNPRWARKDTPIFDDEGKEIGTQTNFGLIDSAVRKEFHDNV